MHQSARTCIIMRWPCRMLKGQEMVLADARLDLLSQG